VLDYVGQLEKISSVFEFLLAMGNNEDIEHNEKSIGNHIVEVKNSLPTVVQCRMEECFKEKLVGLSDKPAVLAFI